MNNFHTSLYCWQILKIEATNDLSVIRQAYATLLKTIDIAAEPEKFQELRDAFDQAKTNAPYIGECDVDEYEQSSDSDEIESYNAANNDELNESSYEYPESVYIEKSALFTNIDKTVEHVLRLLSDDNNSTALELVSQAIETDEFDSLNGRFHLSGQLTLSLSKLDSIPAPFFRGLEKLFGWEDEVDVFQGQYEYQIAYSHCYYDVHGDDLEQDFQPSAPAKKSRPSAFLIFLFIYLIIKACTALYDQYSRPHNLLHSNEATESYLSVAKDSKVVHFVLKSANDLISKKEYIKASEVLKAGLNESNSANLEHALGELYLNQLMDIKQAKIWLLKAARRHHDQAAFSLGELYFNDEPQHYNFNDGPQHSLTQALMVLKGPASRGHAQSIELIDRTIAAMSKHRAQQPRQSKTPEPNSSPYF